MLACLSEKLQSSYMYENEKEKKKVPTVVVIFIPTPRFVVARRNQSVLWKVSDRRHVQVAVT